MRITKIPGSSFMVKGTLVGKPVNSRKLVHYDMRGGSVTLIGWTQSRDRIMGSLKSNGVGFPS